MATSNWSIPTGKTITGATYIKDTDDNISATIEDLVDWCNNSNGTYNDYTLTGLRTDFVDKGTAQTITGAKTFSSAIIASGGVSGNLTGNADTSTTASTATTLTGLTSTISELNKLDGYTGGVTELNYLDTLHATGVTATEFDYLGGVTSNIQTQINGKASLSGATFTGAVNGITPTVASNLTRKDYVDTQISNINALSGAYNPTTSNLVNVSTVGISNAQYIRVGDIVSVFGYIDITPTTASTTTSFYITLPITPATFTTNYQANGTVTFFQGYGTLSSVNSTSLAKITYLAPNTSTDGITFSFSYRV